MKYFSSLLTAALFVATVSAQVTVNTPANVVECAPLTITWSGGTAPYFLSVHSGTDVNGDPLISFPSTTSTSLTWAAVNFTSGTSLDLSLRDSAGSSSQSAIFTVQAGGDSSCLTGGSAAPAGSSTAGGSTSAGSGSASASTPSATSPSTVAVTSAGSTSTTPTTKASGSSSSSSSKSSTTSTSSNAAMATGVTYGVAGVLGAAVAAVFI